MNKLGIYAGLVVMALLAGCGQDTATSTDQAAQPAPEAAPAAPAATEESPAASAVEEEKATNE